MEFIPVVLAALCLAVPIGGIIIWKFVFKGSQRRALTLLLTTLQGDDSDVDPDAPIVASDRVRPSELIEQRAEDDREFEQKLQRQAPVVQQQAELPPTEALSPDRTTSDSGWPVKLNQTLRRMRRPFRLIRLETDHETSNDGSHHRQTHHLPEDKSS